MSILVLLLFGFLSGPIVRCSDALSAFLLSDGEGPARPPGHRMRFAEVPTALRNVGDVARISGQHGKGLLLGPFGGDKDKVVAVTPSRAVESPVDDESSSSSKDDEFMFKPSMTIIIPGKASLDLSVSEDGFVASKSAVSSETERIGELRLGEYIVKVFADPTDEFVKYLNEKRFYGEPEDSDSEEEEEEESSGDDESDDGIVFERRSSSASSSGSESGEDEDDGSEDEVVFERRSSSSGSESGEDDGSEDGSVSERSGSSSFGRVVASAKRAKSSALENVLMFELVYNIDDAKCDEQVIMTNGQILCEAEQTINILVLKIREGHEKFVALSALIDRSENAFTPRPMTKFDLKLRSVHIDHFRAFAQGLLKAIETIHRDGQVVHSELSIHNVFVYTSSYSPSRDDATLDFAISDFTNNEPIIDTSEPVIMHLYSQPPNSIKKDLNWVGEILEEFLNCSGGKDYPVRRRMIRDYRTILERRFEEVADCKYEDLSRVFTRSDKIDFQGGFEETDDAIPHGRPILVSGGKSIVDLNRVVGVGGKLRITDVIYDEEEVRVVGVESRESGQTCVLKFEFTFPGHEDRSGMDNEAEFFRAITASVDAAADPAVAQQELDKYISRIYLVSEKNQYIVGRSFYRSDQEDGEKPVVIMEGTPVRVMVMERLGLSLKDMSRALIKADLKNIALQGIEILKRIHQLGFVHGDVHSGNFVNTLLPAGDARAESPPISIKAIDFGQSLRYDEEPKAYPIGHKSLSFLSLSELDETAPSPKDDLFRWGETLMDIVSDGAYFLDMKRAMMGPVETRIERTRSYKTDFPTGSPKDENGRLVMAFINAAMSLPYNAKPGVEAYEDLSSLFR